jgi:sigma-B regulation protein RsbU (phosphoserine phosphatase)
VPPTIPGLDVGAVYRPAGSGDEVGGDFYDVFQVAEDDWVVALGDVVGKGVDAAVVTSLVRHTLHAVAVRSPSPADVLRQLNRVMLESSPDRWCTVALVRLRREAGVWTAEVCLGGQSQPLLKPAEEPARLFAQPGSLIGVLDEPAFHETRLRLEPGDTVVLYTDGVTEGRNGDEFYGERRLMSVVDAPHAGVAFDLADRILHDLLDFQHEQPRDDVAIVTIRVPRRTPLVPA